MGVNCLFCLDKLARTTRTIDNKLRGTHSRIFFYINLTKWKSIWLMKKIDCFDYSRIWLIIWLKNVSEKSNILACQNFLHNSLFFSEKMCSHNIVILDGRSNVVLPKYYFRKYKLKKVFLIMVWPQIKLPVPS